MSLPRLARLAVGLAACLLVVACSGEGASAPAPPGAGAPAPERHRWVGAGGVVVAVPDWWTTGDTECLLPVEDTVYVETGAMTDCAFTVPPTTPTEVSSLAVVDTGSAHGSRLLEDLSVDGEVGGEPVLSGRECGWLAPRVCRTVLAVGLLHRANPVPEARGDAMNAMIRVTTTTSSTNPLKAEVNLCGKMCHPFKTRVNPYLSTQPMERGRTLVRSTLAISTC